MYAALLAGLITMAAHEIFDFNLQTPANALLFFLILGLALRMSGVGKGPWATEKQWSRVGLALTGSLWALSVVLIFLSLTQDKGVLSLRCCRGQARSRRPTLYCVLIRPTRGFIFGRPNCCCARLRTTALVWITPAGTSYCDLA